VRGKAADARSDIYSLGITLYESLCGHTPFDGENHFDIMQQHLRNRPPPLAKQGVTVPAAVEKVLLTSMEKAAADRFADAGLFRQALEGVLPSLPKGGDATIAAAAPSKRRSRVAPALGLTVLVVGLAGATFLVARHFNPKVKPTTTTTTATTTTTTTKPVKKPMTWPLPHSIAGEVVATDEKFDADGLRVQSTEKRDAAKVRDAYKAILAELKAWLPSTNLPAARALAEDFRVPPLNLVVVPQKLLDDAALWPDLPTDKDVNYTYRYVQQRRTLFVNDGKGFELHGLPDGVALHVLNPVAALSTDDILRLSENFERHYNSKAH